MIRNEKYYLLFCSVLFCSIDSFGCGCYKYLRDKLWKNEKDNSGKIVLGGVLKNSGSAVENKNEILHRYIELLKNGYDYDQESNGYFFLKADMTGFYFSENEREIYSYEQNFSKQQKLGNGVWNNKDIKIIYYNADFDWTTKSPYWNINAFLIKKQIAINCPLPDLLVDCKNTIYVFYEEKCVAKITENEFLLCDNGTLSTCEIFSKQHECQKTDNKFLICLNVLEQDEKGELYWGKKIQLCLNCGLLKIFNEGIWEEVSEKEEKKYQKDIVFTLNSLYVFVSVLASNCNTENEEEQKKMLVDEFGEEIVNLMYRNPDKFSVYFNNKKYEELASFLLGPLSKILKNKWQV